MESCLIIAGEKSGEEHAISFFEIIRSKNPNCQFFGVAGDLLIKQGFQNIYHLNDFSTWGISEAIGRIPFYYKALKKIEDEVVQRGCKVAILIDFQTFNMKLAQRLKKHNVKVLYYVAPQAWAWKSYRTKILQKTVDTLFCILPFEKKWFMDRGVKSALAIEHPVYSHNKDQVDHFKRDVQDFQSSRKIKVLLLPGSRNFEVKCLLPVFIKTLQNFKNIEVSIVKSSSVKSANYEPYESQFNKIYQSDDLIKAIKDADVALAASGTVNLMCALFSLPTVVGYIGSLLNHYIFDTFVNYKGHISIANIVHEKVIFPELIGEFCTEYNMSIELQKLLGNKEYYLNVVNELSKTKNLLKGDIPIVGEFLSEKISEAYRN